MATEKDFKYKKVKFTQFCNFQRAQSKISVFENCSSQAFEAGDFNIFLKFLGFWGSFSYKTFSYKKNVYEAGKILAEG